MTGPRRLLACAVIAGLAGCAAPSRTVGPGLVEDGRISFELVGVWSPINKGRDRDVNADQLTRHGPLLDRLFLASLNDGEGLVTPGFDDHPRWWAGTPPDALDDFLAESLRTLGYEQVEIVSRLDRPFSSGQAAQYGLTMRRPGGLKLSGLVFAAVEAQTLDLVIFVAPQEHYFPARRGEIQHLFDTLARVDQAEPRR